MTWISRDIRIRPCSRRTVFFSITWISRDITTPPLLKKNSIRLCKVRIPTEISPPPCPTFSFEVQYWPLRNSNMQRHSSSLSFNELDQSITRRSQVADISDTTRCSVFLSYPANLHHLVQWLTLCCTFIPLLYYCFYSCHKRYYSHMYLYLTTITYLLYCISDVNVSWQ